MAQNSCDVSSHSRTIKKKRKGGQRTPDILEEHQTKRAKRPTPDLSSATTISPKEESEDFHKKEEVGTDVSSPRLLSPSRHAVNSEHPTSTSLTFFAASRIGKELPIIDLSMRDWMLANEPLYLPESQYMAHKQRHLTPKMRFILLSWLTEVSEECRLHRETMHLAVNFIDRFLSFGPTVARNELQLVGTAALFLASKLEEVEQLTSAQCVATTDNTYTQTQLFKMEQILLQVLNWRLMPTTPITWLKYYVTVDYAIHSSFQRLTDDNSEEISPNFFSLSSKSNVSSNSNNNDHPLHLATVTNSVEEGHIGNELAQLDVLNVETAKQLYYRQNIFPKELFFRMARTLDVLVLDYESLHFPPSVLAAAVFAQFYFHQAHKTPPSLLHEITGLHDLSTINKCLDWMKQKYNLSLEHLSSLAVCADKLPSDFHLRQYKILPEHINLLSRKQEGLSSAVATSTI
jgi:hypothetical protein